MNTKTVVLSLLSCLLCLKLCNVNGQQVVSVDSMDQSTPYDVVVFLNDISKYLGAEFESIESTITAHENLISNGHLTGTNVISFPQSPNKRLIFASTGRLDNDLADSRLIFKAAETALNKVYSMGLKRVLLVVGPMKTALPEFEWVKGIYPKLTAALGALNGLYVPLQVREMTGLVNKIDYLGLYKYDEKLTEIVLGINSGVMIQQDIGNTGPHRMPAIKIVELLEKKRTQWKLAGIDMRVEMPDKKKHPLAFAVNQATEEYKEHDGRIVYLEYTPPKPEKINQTVLLVGKGCTFDTGGVNLKINSGMVGMHVDKMGAAAVAGFFEMLAKLKPDGLKVFGYMPYIRNSIGKLAYVPDDILVARNNLRVRIGNTDAEGRVLMSDVLFEAKEEAKKAINPHVLTVATLTGFAKAAYGDVSVTMDNGPARQKEMAKSLSKSGELVADLTATARILIEDFEINYPNSEYENVEQLNNKPGVADSRGFSLTLGYLAIVSGLDKHGLGAEVPIPYSHIDIAGSTGGIKDLGTGTPMRLLANKFIIPRILA